MNDIPLLVANVERVVRGICTPFHVSSSGKLKPEAFEAPADSDAVSVIRHDYVGVDFCKLHAQKLSRPDQSKKYSGLAVIRAGAVRACEADVVDSRSVFLGHADIKHGHKRSALDPPAPEIVKMLKDRCKALAKVAVFFSDPDPDGSKWTGLPLDCEARQA
jgi:hypothetical protein